jgi:hypothetical protein
LTEEGDSTEAVWARRLSQLEDGDSTESVWARSQLEDGGPLTESVKQAKRAHRQRQERCKISHANGSAALLRFEAVAFLSAAASLVFIHVRRRQAAQRRGGTALLPER